MSSRLPGRWLLAIARVVFDEAVFGTVVSQTIADMRDEWLRAGSDRRARNRARWNGYLAFWKVVVMSPVGAENKTTTVVRRGLSWLGVALLVLLGLVGTSVPYAQVALWYVVDGGPPLDFDRPHDGQVVAHIDVLGRYPPDLARIRISEVSTGATVWDVKPTTARSECWNACWNLTFKVGSNPASFAAGHQQFNASAPQGPSFSLAPGTTYLFEAWDSRGRAQRHRFTL